MIRSIYKKNVKWSSFIILWAGLMFLVVNYFIFFAFMNICFQSLVQNPPEPIIVGLLTVILFDLFWYIIQTGRFCNFNNLLDLAIIISLTVSFVLTQIDNSSWSIYLQVVVLIKIKDVFYFKHIMYQLMKKNKFSFRLFTIFKIVYFIILIGHITGCIFYAIDNILIKQQYFGSLAENPDLYYQGNLHVFSPIYGLSQLERYVYAIYFTFSLLSTVAFGDIIPKNYFQNVYVSILLVGATIGIALIVQQMYIVFRSDKTKKYQLINKIKYVSEYLRSQKHISRQFRYELINYTVDSQWKQITQAPNLKILTNQMISKMLESSLLCQNDLPLVIKKYFLRSMSSKYYPSNYKLVDNNLLSNNLFGVIILDAKAKIGYTTSLVGLTQVPNNIFGFQQLILTTNYHHRYLNVLLAKQAQVFILDQTKFTKSMNQLKLQTNNTFQSPIQSLQIAKDQIVLKSKRQACLYCYSQYHTLLNCKKCHHNPQISYSDLYIKQFNQKRNNQVRRTSLNSKKYTSFNCSSLNKQIVISKQHFQHKKYMKQPKIKLKNIYQNYIENLMEYDQIFFVKPIQKYHQWQFYNTNFNV